jgi:hypothetical protein
MNLSFNDKEGFMKKTLFILISFLLCTLLTGPALSFSTENYKEWHKDHKKASPIWVLPKALAPSNMQWTVPSMPGDLDAKRFYSPEICSSCHTEIYNQWKGAMHANAWIDPLFVPVYKLYLKNAKTKHEKEETAMCSKCHTPTGYLADESGRYFQGKLSEISEKGVFCDFCHSVKFSAGIGNGPFIPEPGDASKNIPGTKRGPRRDSVSPFHKTEFSELHTRAAFCGMCHDVSHATTVMSIESTYTEWRQGPYFTGDPETTTTCQDCHMKQTVKTASTGITERPDSPGFAAPEVLGAKKRKHIWQHVFVGGNAASTSLLGFDNHAKMAEDRIKHAALLSIEREKESISEGLSRFSVKVTNAGAGHYLPTGITFIRQMWLHVTVKDKNGAVIFESGKVDKEGNIDPGAVIYRSVLGDKDGKPTYFLPGAGIVISDYRIPPLGYKVEKYSFPLNTKAKSPYSVKAVLKYRSAPQSLVKNLLGKDAPTLPILDMAEASGTLK